VFKNEPVIPLKLLPSSHSTRLNRSNLSKIRLHLNSNLIWYNERRHPADMSTQLLQQVVPEIDAIWRVLTRRENGEEEGGRLATTKVSVKFGTWLTSLKNMENGANFFFCSIEYSKAKSFFCSFRGFRPTTPEQGSALDPVGWLPLDRCSSGVSITHFLTKHRPSETCNERPVMRADIEPEAVLIVEAVQRELLIGRDRQLVGRIVDGLHPMIAPLTPMHTHNHHQS